MKKKTVFTVLTSVLVCFVLFSLIFVGGLVMKKGDKMGKNTSVYFTDNKNL